MKNKIFFIALFLCVLAYINAYADSDNRLYLQGVRAAKNGEPDVAFMNFKIFMESAGESKFAQNALFAIGEYYFSISNYDEAFSAFSRFIQDYPRSKARIFALSYLLEIAKKQKNITLAEKIEKAIVSARQVVLLFAESKESKYLSSLFKKHKAVYFIDRVDFYIDDVFFTKARY